MQNHQDPPIKSPVTRIEGQYLGNPSEVSEVSIAVRRDPDQAASDPTPLQQRLNCRLHGFKLSRIEPQLCCKDASSRAIQRENSLVERSERNGSVDLDRRSILVFDRGFVRGNAVPDRGIRIAPCVRVARCVLSEIRARCEDLILIVLLVEQAVDRTLLPRESALEALVEFASVRSG